MASHWARCVKARGACFPYSEEDPDEIGIGAGTSAVPIPVLAAAPLTFYRGSFGLGLGSWIRLVHDGTRSLVMTKQTHNSVWCLLEHLPRCERRALTCVPHMSSLHVAQIAWLETTIQPERRGRVGNEARTEIIGNVRTPVLQSPPRG